MDKYEYIVNLAEKTAKRVSQNRESWMKFLTSAARIYKYPFKEQLLIYAQNPDATACASIEIWNKRMNCWVNKGSSGIALPDDIATYGHKLKYVFDVSNVHAVKPNGRYPKAWKLREEHKSDVLHRLEQIYGSTDSTKPFEERIIEISDQLAADAYTELQIDYPDLQDRIGFDKLSEQDFALCLKKLISESVSFTILSACGIEDSWAASFGETQTAIELAPEGVGYRTKRRFSRFFNLPELISVFKEAADIKTADMLNLPVPEAQYENVVLKPSEYQKEMVASLANRAEAVRNQLVSPYQDNMLRITNDGRKLALDQRLINEMLPANENSKVAVCAEKSYHIWEETTSERSTQLIFCDLSTPRKNRDESFSVYDELKSLLMKKGVPEDEIAFIHDANTDQKKAELFAKVRSGQVRFLIGSTSKMGAGTNVQDRLIALHHLDVPWRPSDIEQQEGRILRQGNRNRKVKIFRYVTEGTFDAYSWQLIENKQKFISQIMTSKSPVRSCEDVDESALSYAEVKALATGNPYIKEKMDLDIQVSRLRLLKANYTSQKYRMEDNIVQHYPRQIVMVKELIEKLEQDIALYEQNAATSKDKFHMQVGSGVYDTRKDAGNAIIKFFQTDADGTAKIGTYLGFSMNIAFDSFNRKFVLRLKGAMNHPVEIGPDPVGNIIRLNNVLKTMPDKLAEAKDRLETLTNQL